MGMGWNGLDANPNLKYKNKYKVSFQIQNRNGLDANPNLKYKSEVERDERVL